MDALRRRGAAAVVALAACTANPPAPAAEAPPPPEAPPPVETPPAPETPPVDPEPPPPATPPVPTAPAASLALYPVLAVDSFVEFDKLPSGHILVHDDARFAVVPMSEARPAGPAGPKPAAPAEAKPAEPKPADAAPADPAVPEDSPARPDPEDSKPPGAAITTLALNRAPTDGPIVFYPLPDAILENLDLDLDDDDDEEEDEEDEESYDHEDDFELVSLHGAWPDHFFATTERSVMRSGTERDSYQWKAGAWAEIPKIDDGESGLRLSLTTDRLHPWTKSRYLAERDLSCHSGCPEEGMEGDDDDPLSRIAAKQQRRLDRLLERHKPLAVIGGHTPLPDMSSIFAFDVMALPTGDLWITTTGNSADRWNLGKKAWEKHALPAVKGGSVDRLAGTSTGAAWYARCEPEPVLAFLDAGATAPVALPAPGCVTRMVVDHADTLWITLSADGRGIRGELPTLWRLADPKATWEPVQIAPLVFPAAPETFSSDGRAWEPLAPISGNFGPPRITELFTHAGEFWAVVDFEKPFHVLLRARPGATLYDARTLPPPFDDVAACIDQHVELGSLPRDADPGKPWAEALAIVGSLATDRFAPRVYVVDAADRSTYYATVREASPAARVGLQVRLKASLPAVSDVRCGLPPRPTREYPLDVPAPPDEADDDDDAPPAEAKP